MTPVSPEASPTLPRWHVLLIGIDAYLGGAPPLGGCVNDIDAVQRLLIERIKVPKDRIRRYAAPLNDTIARPTEIETGLPTRERLLDAFKAIAAEVREGQGDHVFIYYSGHGTHRFVQPADGTRYFCEAIVPHDNVVVDATTGDDREQLIFDWELNEQLAKIAGKTTSITVILDCCCSAGATRDLVKPGSDIRTRYAKPRTAGDLQLPAGARAPDAATRGVAAVASGSLSGCMVVAACLDDESARESRGPAGPAGAAETLQHGELTRALLGRLAQVSDPELLSLPWAQIWRAVVDDVSAASPNQTPWLSSHLGRLVFCGPPTDGDLGYTVRKEGSQYLLNVGSLSGVTTGAVIALYPPLPRPRQFPPLGTPEDLAARQGLLRVTSASRATATAEAVAENPPPDPLPSGARGRLAAARGTARLRVALSPHDEQLALRIKASALLEVVLPGAPGDVELLAHADGGRELTDGVFGPDPVRGAYTLWVIPAEAINTPPLPGKPDPVVVTLEQYFAYSAPLRMARGCTDLPHLLRIRLLDCGGLTDAIPAEEADRKPLEELQADRAPDYQLRAGRVDASGNAPADLSAIDLFAIELENTSDRDLFVTLFSCQNSGEVGLYGSQILVTKHSRARAWFEATRGMPIVPVLPDGVSRGLDQLVAIGTTRRGATLDHLKSDATFAGVARGFGERGGLGLGGTPELWTSAIAVLRMTT